MKQAALTGIICLATLLIVTIVVNAPTQSAAMPLVVPQELSYNTSTQINKAPAIKILPPLVLSKKINMPQAKLLKYAFEIAKEDGHADPSILQGLIWQESHAGGYPGYEVAGDEAGLAVGKRYYGIGQIKVAAARDVFRHFPDDFPGMVDRTAEYIIAKLITDHKFNIRVASKYLWLMQHNKQTNFIRPTNYAITAYNRGLGNTYDTDYNNWHYTVSVHKHKDTFIKEFNLVNNIE